MNDELFWKLIKQSRRGTEDGEAQAEKLTSLLAKLEPSEIVAFDELLAKRRNEAYRWDLWAVAYIINGGCSDDGFEYFRCWLIAQGREFFEATLKNPEHAAKRIEVGDEAECEDLLYVAPKAYEIKTGQELPPRKTKHLIRPKGKRWKEDELENLFPKLCKRFS